MKRFLLAVCLFCVSAHAQDAPAPEKTAPENMVLVAAGEFIMGTDSADRHGTNVPLANNDARPRRTATLPAFWIDKTEVTNAQYSAFCVATHYPAPPQWKDGKWPEGQENYPVTRVSWYEAGAFAAWAGKRLPTEAEWEKAARGTDGRRFPWGEGFDGGRLIWGTNGPREVGQKPEGASPCGALDMAGNVFEWTADWFDAYPDAPERLPSFGKLYKVVRGGGWMGFDSICQTWYRSVDRPTARSEWVGFRCVKDAN